MTEAAILDGLEAIAKQHLSYEGPLPLDAPIVDTLTLDSIRMLTLVVEVENLFEVCLEEADESSIKERAAGATPHSPARPAVISAAKRTPSLGSRNPSRTACRSGSISYRNISMAFARKTGRVAST